MNRRGQLGRRGDAATDVRNADSESPADERGLCGVVFPSDFISTIECEVEGPRGRIGARLKVVRQAHLHITTRQPIVDPVCAARIPRYGPS